MTTKMSGRSTLRAICAFSAVLFVLTVSPRPAAADPLQIQNGFLFLDNDPARSFALDFSLEGDGFHFISEVIREERDFLEGFTESNFRLQFSPSEVPSWTCAGCGYEGDLTFRTTGPSLPNGWTPFTMTGTLAEFAPGASQPTFRHELIGSGRMSSLAPVSVIYQFTASPDPVPEPSTLLLLGTGLVAAVRARRRRRSTT